MKKMLKTIFTWIWCFPQMLVGLIVMIVTKAKKSGDHYRYKVNSGSVTLGTFIFLCPSHWDNEKVLRHEKGHMVQSYYLGWLYLFVIGLPSLIWCGCFEKYRQKHGISYYDFYTERWANKIAGITD
nr:MAG TPA: protein of unknown function (DUF3976) [Caudoviricetes sp.]